MYDELLGNIRQLLNYKGLMPVQVIMTYKKFLSEAADAIEELSKPKWIPVTERLPDKPGIYAVWTAKGFGNHLAASYFDGDSWSLRITHWMPLPEPTKEE